MKPEATKAESGQKLLDLTVRTDRISNPVKKDFTKVNKKDYYNNRMLKDDYLVQVDTESEDYGLAPQKHTIKQLGGIHGQKIQNEQRLIKTQISQRLRH